jgi:polyphosphate glucokinase
MPRSAATAANSSPADACRIGIDVGGTGIKAAAVDTHSGDVLGTVLRVPTPQPAGPEEVTAAIADLLEDLSPAVSAGSPVGIAMPAVIQQGVARSAANIDDSWIGLDTNRYLTDALNRPAQVLNDADAAGLAEVRYGAGRDRAGVVIVLTFGTGIGSGLFVDGALVPNTELGHLELRGREAEKWAAESVRERKGLSWQKWGKRVDEYLRHLEMLLSPDLFVVGGGVSKKSTKFFPYLATRAEIVPAQLLNEAGIVGAAVAASDPDRRPAPRAAVGVPAGSSASSGATQTSWTSPGSTSPS